MSERRMGDDAVVSRGKRSLRYEAEQEVEQAISCLGHVRARLGAMQERHDSMGREMDLLFGENRDLRDQAARLEDDNNRMMKFLRALREAGHAFTEGLPHPLGRYDIIARPVGKTKGQKRLLKAGALQMILQYVDIANLHQADAEILQTTGLRTALRTVIDQDGQTHGIHEVGLTDVGAISFVSHAVKPGLSVYLAPWKATVKRCVSGPMGGVVLTFEVVSTEVPF